MARKKRTITRILFLILIVVSLLILFFNSNGLIHYLKLSADLTKSKEEIKGVEDDIDHLDKEIDSLKSNDFKIERTAREKYNMKSPSEEVLEVEER